MTEATVERLRLFLIESPIKMARLQGVGNVKGTVKRVLLELTGSDGIVGWGEAAPWEVFTGTPEAAFSALDIYLRPIVLDKPVRRIRALMAELDRALVGHAEAKVAIEMALLDIVSANQPDFRSPISSAAACATPSHCRSRSPILISPQTLSACGRWCRPATSSTRSKPA